MTEQIPWWVEGALVHQAFEAMVVYVTLAKFTVRDVDDLDGCCLREQLWYDSSGAGVNQDAGRRIRAAVKRVHGRKP
jgi:hypothetical protein